MFKLFSSLFFFLFLCGCASKEPQMIIIDSNVSAFVYYEEERLGMTPFAQKLPKNKIAGLELKQAGYETIKVPVEKAFSRKSPIFSSAPIEVTKEGEIIPGLVIAVTLPVSVLTDVLMLSSGESIEYMPNAYYIELVPMDRKQAGLEIFKNLQVKKFALKTYPSLALGEDEALQALSALSGKTESEIKTHLLQTSDAPSFATALVR